MSILVEAAARSALAWIEITEKVGFYEVGKEYDRKAGSTKANQTPGHQTYLEAIVVGRYDLYAAKHRVGASCGSFFAIDSDTTNAGPHPIMYCTYKRDPWILNEKPKPPFALLPYPKLKRECSRIGRHTTVVSLVASSVPAAVKFDLHNLSEVTKLSYSTLRKWIDTGTGHLSAQQRRLLATALGVSPDDLV